MPGIGDFNLSAFFRAMGIKNPAPSVRETVQPVVVVGQLGGLTPRYENPTSPFGGNVSAIVAEFSYFTVTAAAPGGCLIRNARSDALDVVYGTAARVPGLTVVVPSGQFSVNPVQSVVESGTDAVNAIGSAVANPKIQTNTNFSEYGGPFYVPPGITAVFQSTATNQALTDWSLMIEDLPSAENSTV